MKKYLSPTTGSWPEIVARPVFDTKQLQEKVQAVLESVRLRGDDAVKEFTQTFDGIQLDALQVSSQEIDTAEDRLSEGLKAAIKTALKNIYVFHDAHKVKPVRTSTMPGVTCWKKVLPIEKVGLYIPGGSAPLFSTVLMLGIPAQIAGCKEIVLCTPPGKDGDIHPAILYAAQLTGITKIFRAGGAQAIAAMAYGTASIPKVYKIFGPGNQYVTCAKQLVQMEGVAIDMPAGPSEVCVLADDTADAGFVASDLLSQAEHGADSQSVLITVSEKIMATVEQEVESQLSILERKDIARKSIAHSKLVYMDSMDDAIDLVNEYAPEHLIISCAKAEAIAERITNAGSVFLGNYSPESAGDYASGTNHTLPTNGFAKAYSGISVESFTKNITFQQLTEDGLANIAETVVEMAAAEGLSAHANAVKIRINKNSN